MDFDDHHNYNVDHNDNSSSSQDYDIPENDFDYNDDFPVYFPDDIPEDSFDYNEDNFHDYDHDLKSTYLPYPADSFGFPCSTTPQILNFPSPSLSDASHSLGLNKEMSTSLPI